MGAGGGGAPPGPGAAACPGGGEGGAFCASAPVVNAMRQAADNRKCFMDTPLELAATSGRDAPHGIDWRCSGDAPIAVTSTTLPATLTRSIPRAAIARPGANSALNWDTSGGGTLRTVPSSSRTPLMSP